MNSKIEQRPVVRRWSHDYRIVTEVESGGYLSAERMADEHNALHDYVLRLEQWLGECFEYTRADPDGNEPWRLVPHATKEVQRLRQDHDRLERRNQELEERVRSVPNYAYMQKLEERLNSLKEKEQQLAQVRKAVCDLCDQELGMHYSLCEEIRNG